MMNDREVLISGVRAGSRALVRELGFMGRTVAGTDLSPSAVHAVIEIGAAPGLTARDLGQKLRLEKSTVSRLLASLIERGDITDKSALNDGRTKTLHLTKKGRERLAGIDNFARDQVCRALDRLGPDECASVMNGLQTYAQALEDQPPVGGTSPVQIHRGYTPGLPAQVVQMMVRQMQNSHQFGQAFEARLLGDMAEFTGRKPSDRTAMWWADLGGSIAGSITIDGDDLAGNIAHLRWFVVDPFARGHGVGRRLLEAALAFCDDAMFDEIHLWTVAGLNVARGLYERRDFVLVDEWQGDQWGSPVTEQKFVRLRP